ncbi:hypothetical protein K2X30_06400 [bacterium]|nr:hypothetical protein [bacterium]
MELTHDWRVFHRIFYSHDSKTPVQNRPSPIGPIYVVVHQDRIVSALSDGEDFSNLVGSSYKEFSQQKSFREIIAFERDHVDSWLGTSLSLPHYFEQQEFLRTQAFQAKGKRDWTQSSKRFRPHFLLKSLQSWWRKVLPSNYGIYIRLTGTEGHVVLLVRNGMFVGFHEPDLTSFYKQREVAQKIAKDIIRAKSQEQEGLIQFFKDKYQVPFFTVFASAQDWQAWSRLSNPWVEVLQAMQKKTLKVVPFRWGVAFLLGLRAYLGI